MRTIIITSIALFSFMVRVNAYEGGVCKSLSPAYKDIDFKLEISADLQYAKDFKIKHNGQFITDGDKEMYYVIWSNQVAAPETQYTCTRVSED